MFSWKPIYQEIATKLLAYRDRQDELISWLNEMKDEGIPVIKLDDENPKTVSIPLAEIDLFSFFANFNRAIKNTHRIRILEILKTKMDLVSPIPDDFDGIPVVNLQKAIFFPFAYDRDEHMVPTLWDLADQVVNLSSEDVNSELFSRALDIPQVGLAKLTIGMFWMRPDRYLAFDSLLAAYAKDNEVKIGKLGKVKTFEAYLEMIGKITSALGNDYPQISRDAYLFANQVPVSVEELDAGLKKLLQAQATKNGLTIDQVVQQISGSSENDENEMNNRIQVLPLIESALSKPLETEAFKKLLPKLWVFQNGQDSIRRNALLDSDVAIEAIDALLDNESGVDDLSRVDAFVDIAITNGYSTPNGSSDSAGAAQFASVLLSATRPNQFVDFREGRWNKLYSLIAESKQRLCSGSSCGWKLIRAGKYAAALASTDTFKQYFGEGYGTWKAAGLAWCFKDGLYEMKKMEQKRYWAGGFLWGGQGGDSESHLEEFVDGNYWKTGYSRNGTTKKHTDHWALFDQIAVGDEFAIKGYGGRNDLKIYYVGTVTEIISDEGLIRMNNLDRKLYRGKAPSLDGANWFGTIVPVTTPAAIRQVFYCDNNAKENGGEILNIGLNTILYGPPGTGKTYALRNDYMRRFTETQSMKSKDQFAQELVETLSWWEVVTLVMHDLKTAKVADIMAHPLMLVRIARSENNNPRAAIWAHLQMHTKRDCETVAYTRRYEPLMFSKSDASIWSIDNTVAEAAVPELLEKLDQYKNFKPSSSGNVKRYVFTTFHQSFSYEDFIEGIKPVIGDEVAGELAYEIRSGVFKQIAQRARMDPDHAYAIFIDEINRGNVASIFGELITLLEDDKRLGAANELTATLPYSHDVFGVPSNLYVIGTMNTADRSVEALDTALRRRFTFVPYRPRPELLEDYQPATLGVNLERLLVMINARIERLLDDDHSIGHSYFMGLKDEPNPLDGLRRVFANKVLPLLQEYFYGDPARVGMVLGKAFVTRRQDSCDLAQGDWDPDGIDERDVYAFANPMELPEEAFVSIYA